MLPETQAQAQLIRLAPHWSQTLKEMQTNIGLLKAQYERLQAEASRITRNVALDHGVTQEQLNAGKCYIEPDPLTGDLIMRVMPLESEANNGDRSDAT